MRDIAFLGARTSVRVELADGRVITADLASRTVPADVTVDAPCRFRGAAPTCGR
ncbi:hypothetical protein GS421_15475 [Rhodococcus hoagii]|nr:hypothetical protein [Prescottella equi]